ncbi:MAG: ctaA, partial [Frankiales bacterium]|nr:ctaA [Frankiales bacterium]
MNSTVFRLSLFTVLSAAAVLAFGGLTTSFRAGMADPVWPTHPLFLFYYGQNYDYEKDRAFLLEHNHRRLGFTLGAASSLLALTAWFSGPKKSSRLFGLIAVIVLLTCYGDLHRRMMDAWDLRREGKPWAWPHGAIYSTLTSTGLLVLASVNNLFTKQSGKWVRFWVSLILIAVMIQ